MAKPNLRLVTPTTENRTVTPRRAPNAELRTREHLTADEVDKLIEAAKANRYGRRDALMVLLAYRHGLRAADAKAQTLVPRCRRSSVILVGSVILAFKLVLQRFALVPSG
jgi:site-specific recombinase XerD